MCQSNQQKVTTQYTGSGDVHFPSRGCTLSSWGQESILSSSTTTTVTASLQPGQPGREEPHSASPHLISSSHCSLSPGGSLHCLLQDLWLGLPLDVGIQGWEMLVKAQGASLHFQAGPLIPDP